jgi:hypothetical protein
MTDLNQLLNFDMLDAAEKITGASYKESEVTALLGMALGMRNGEAKLAALSAAGDTHSKTTPNELKAMLLRAGFVMLVERHFTGEYGPDIHRIFWNASEGLLLNHDTFWGAKSINGGNIYFNWEPHEGERDFPNCGISGGYRGDVLAGGFDIREGLFNHLGVMRNAGSFIPVWSSSPFLWLKSYADDGRYRDANAARIAEFPAAVQAAIRGEQP